MISNEIQQWLLQHQDQKYGEFQRKLMPTVASDAIIGVRTPELRRYTRELMERPDIDDFLTNLPHMFFEENQLHVFILSLQKDVNCLFGELEIFLPYIDNWATCDMLSPKVLKKHKSGLLLYIRKWLLSEHPYTVRFGIGMLMEHYLEDDFAGEYPEMVCAIRSQEYYVNMMIAWYFATALAKQYEAVLPYLKENRLAKWTHNKTIQKAVESNRICAERKNYLKTLRMR